MNNTISLKKHILFIINPHSGSVKKHDIPWYINTYIDASKYEVSYAYTTHAGHATELAQEAVAKKTDIVCAIGGDGSVHEVGNGIMHSDVTLALIPIGSGNGFANSLGYSPRNIKKAIDIINAGNTQRIDVGKANEHYFFSTFGVGLDGTISYYYKSKKIRNIFVYAYLLFKQIVFFLKSYTVSYTYNGKKQTGKFIAFALFNASQYGYNLGLAPWASMTDGVLDIAMVKPFSVFQSLWVTICIIFKKYHWSNVFEHVKTTSCEIENIDNAHVQLDGDPVLMENIIRLSILPKALKIIVP